MAKFSVGIEFSDKYIKIITLVSKGKGVHLHSSVCKPLNANISNKKEFLSSIKDVAQLIKKEINIPLGAAVTISIPQEIVVLKTLPFVHRSLKEEQIDIEKKVTQLIKTELNFPIKHCCWDYQIFDNKQHKKEKYFVFALIKKELLSTIFEALKFLSIRTIDTIEPVVASIANSFVYNYPESSSGPFIYLSLFKDKGMVVVNHRDKIWWLPIIIQKEDDQAQPLVRQLKSALKYYNFQEGEVGQKEPFEAIYICKENGRFDGLEAAIEKDLGLKVQPFNPCSKVKINDEAKRVDICVYSACIGAALKTLEEPYYSINLNKQISEEKSSKTFNKFAVIITSSILFLLLTLFSVIAYKNFSSFKKFKGQFIGFEEIHKKILPQLKEIDSHVAQVQENISFLESLENARRVWLVSLDAIKKALPDTIWLTSCRGGLSIEDSKVMLTIEAEGSTYEEINAFLNKLKNTELFSEVKPLSSEASATDQVQKIIFFSAQLIIDTIK